MSYWNLIIIQEELSIAKIKHSGHHGLIKLNHLPFHINRALNSHTLGVKLTHFDPFSQHLALYEWPKFSHSGTNLAHSNIEKLRALYKHDGKQVRNLPKTTV